ncbi:hypothetical protein LZ578_04550 [Jeotgalibaca sp. MA1X17-3]|nr:hypothetical protein [Jeotgalibaca sp. MA1X17-3]UJF16393.1 hypothetical protein LZ578_04550 [Jeotgalibaca sp. MA1X17-3]
MSKKIGSFQKFELDAKSEYDVIRTIAACLLSVKKGNVISQKITTLKAL